MAFRIRNTSDLPIDRSRFKPQPGETVRWAGHNYIVVAVGTRYVRMRRDGSPTPYIAPIQEVQRLAA